MEELLFDDYEIIKTIETYELYLALIFSGLEYIHKDKELSEWSEGIIKNADTWLSNNSNNDVFKENINFIIKFRENNGFYIGIGKGDTLLYYITINSIIRYCFYPDGKGEKINIGKEICKNVDIDKLHNKKDIFAYCKDIDIFYFNNSDILGIKSLIEYFHRAKLSLNEKYERKKNTKLPVKKGVIIPSINVNILELVQNNTFNNDGDKVFINVIIEEFTKINNNLQLELNEIKKTVDLELHYNKPLKLLFLHEYAIFKDTLEILIKKGYILNNKGSEYFKWNYQSMLEKKKREPVKQNGNILFAFLLFDFFYIPKLKYEGKILIVIRDNIKNIGEGFYNAPNFKAVNSAFKIPNLENCGIKDKNEIPRDYIDLLEDIGLINESNLIRPGLKTNTQKK